MIDHDTVILRNPRVEFRRLGEEEGGVLLHLDTAAYHGLNEVGCLVWTLLDGINFGELLVRLREELEDVPATLDSEISEFLDGIAERGLVSFESG
jgi:hypothetical protein